MKAIDRDDYRVRDGHAGLRNTMADLLDFVIRGVNCNERIIDDIRTSQALRDYHTGKAAAFREVLTLFERYKIKQEKL